MGPEAKIQKSVIDYARKRHGALCKKMEAGRFGSTGWPDYMILNHHHVFFIEFKRPGGALTPLQVHMREAICKLGFKVYLVDDVAEGKEIVDGEMG